MRAVGPSMRSMKHILIFTPGFARNEEDYNCSPPLQAFLPALRAARPGLRITVVALHYPFTAGLYKWKGFQVHALGGSNVRPPFSRFLLWRKAKRKLFAIHKEYPIDLIHSFWLHECTLLGKQVARRLGIPVVATVQGQDALPENRYLSFLDFTKIRIIALSQRGADTLRSMRKVPDLRVIPWGLPPEDFPANTLGLRNLDVLGVGSLVAVKDWSTFLDVLERLRRYHPFLKACLIGEGELRGVLEREAKDRQLDQVLEMPGELPRKEVLEVMQRSKVLLHTAKFEGQGYVFEEALAQGMRIVSTHVGMAKAGPRWTLGSEPGELAEKVRDALGKPVPGTPGNADRIEDTVTAILEVYER